MNIEKLIEIGLNDEEPLKVIMRGHVQDYNGENVAVATLMFVTTDAELAREKIYNYQQENDYFYMVYSVPLDTELTTLTHYPSIAFTKEDIL